MNRIDQTFASITSNFQQNLNLILIYIGKVNFEVFRRTTQKNSFNINQEKGVIKECERIVFPSRFGN